MVVTDEIKSQVRKLHEGKMPSGKIAKEVGIQKVQVDRILKPDKTLKQIAMKLVSAEAKEIPSFNDNYRPAETVLQKMDKLAEDTQAIYARAMSTPKPNDYIAIKAIQTQADLISTKVKLMNTIKDLQREDIRIHPQFILFRNAVLRTLDRYPDARAELVKTLSRIAIGE